MKQFDTESPEEKEALDQISDSVDLSPKKADTFGANDDNTNEHSENNLQA